MSEDRKGRVLAQGSNNVLLDKDGIDEVFVDGIGQMNIGPFVSKVKFFKVINVDAKDNAATFETRELSLSIVMPTVTLYAWIMDTLPVLGANLDTMDRATKESMALMGKLAGVKIDNSQ